MDTRLQNIISNISENKYHFLMSLQNVRGVGLGFKTINNYVTNELCIHVLVEKKLDNSLIVNSKNIIPKTYMGIKTDVLEIGNPKPRGVFTNKVRPLQGGYSIVPSNKYYYGTLGCIVTKLDKNKKRTFYILSNNHILADYNKIPIGTTVLQPAKVDGGNVNTDVVASLFKFVPLNDKVRLDYTTYVDAAIAKIDNESLVSTIIASSGKIKGVADAVPNTYVKKSGRTTGLTEGIITTINVTDYSGAVLYKQQIFARLENDGGDSGSVLLDKDNKAIGLLHSGTSRTTIACPMKLVLKALDVKIFVSDRI